MQRGQCGWREGCVCGKCLGLHSSQWQEHDTSKLNVDPWVQLVPVGVDTNNRQIDPIRKSNGCRLSWPALMPYLLTHLYSLEMSLQQACQQVASEKLWGLEQARFVIQKCTGYTRCSCGGRCWCRQCLRPMSCVGDSGLSFTHVGGRAGLGNNGFYL